MTEGANHEVTRLLHEWAGGSRQALTRLMDLVYPELRRIAAQHLRRERRGHTLQPTALVHEAYLRLAGDADRDWRDRMHFFAVAARIVRHILIDYARSRQRLKRGSGPLTITCLYPAARPQPQEVDLLDLDRALTALERLDGRQCQVVELRYFAGLSVEETAAALRVSESSVKRDWVVAKTWLRQRMQGDAAHTHG